MQENGRSDMHRIFKYKLYKYILYKYKFCKLFSNVCIYTHTYIHIHIYISLKKLLYYNKLNKC